MNKDFADIYREIENIDLVSGLNFRSLHVSADGMSWKDPPTISSLGANQSQLLDLYRYMFLARKTDEEIEKFQDRSRYEWQLDLLKLIF